MYECMTARRRLESPPQKRGTPEQFMSMFAGMSGVGVTRNGVAA